MPPDSNLRLPGAVALRRRHRLALSLAFGLVPVVAFVEILVGLEAALGAATIVAALLVLSWTSRETLRALEAIEQGNAELRNVEQRWHYALEGAAHGVFDWNPISGRVYRSDGWHRLLGYSREEIDGLDAHWENTIHPEDQEIAREFRNRLSSGEHRSAQAEYRIRHASGQWRWVLSRGTVFNLDQNGRPERIVGTTTDLTEYKAARQQVEDSFDVFRAMFEESAYPMVLSDLSQRRVTMINPAAAALFGHPREELVGSNLAHLGLWKAADSERMWEQLQAHGPVRDFLVQIGERSMLLFADVIRIRGEEMCLTYAVDITDRERSAAAERRVHELQRSLFEHSPLPMAVLSAETFAVVDINQATVEFFGLTRDEVIGRSSDELRIWSEAGVREQHLKQLREEGRLNHVERRVRTRNGPRDMQLSAEIIEAGGERLVLVQFTDVTQRRQAELRTAQVTRFYAALSEILEAGSRARDEESFLSEVCRICMTCTGTHIAFAVWLDESGHSATVRGHAGEKAAAYIAGLNIVLDPRDPRGWGTLGRAVRSGQPVICNDTTTDSALEPWRERLAAVGTGSLSALPLSMGGRVVGAICLHHPYPDAYDEPTRELVGRIAMSASRTLDQLAYEHDRKSAQNELSRLNQELDQRVRSRTRELQTTVQELESFSYSVAHDLRAPLRAINAYLQMGADPAMDSHQARDYLRKAATSVAGLAELIDDLLEFARAGRRTLDRSLVDMDGLARGVADSLQALHPHTQVVIKPLPPVAGDAFLLRQVLHNLIENALKFSANSTTPRVEVYAEESDQTYVYRVRDNGVGFDMKYSDNIFGVFQRLHDVRDFAGTGVGLAIVKRVVERHQGRVWCDARPGEGATFSLALASLESRTTTFQEHSPNHGNPAG